jgi:hypothetical protein
VGSGGTLRPAAAITAPPHSGRRGRSALLLLLVIAVIGALASAGVVVGGGLSLRGPHSPRLSTTEVLFERLVGADTSAQGLVATATARACEEAPPGTSVRAALLGDLDRAVVLRQSVLRELGADRAERPTMPDGPALMNDLERATADGLTVDEEDQGWLQDLQATGCYGAPTNDIHYRAAALAAPAAAAAEQRLADAWAKVDPSAVGPR